MKRFLVLAIISVLFLGTGCAPRKVAKAPEAQEEAPVVQPSEEQPVTEEKAPEEVSIIKEAPAEVQVEEMPEEVAKLKVEIFKDVHFDFNKYYIKPEYTEQLKNLADYLISNPQIKLIIEGHCDERGTNEYNLALGDKRANAVKEFLISAGVSADRIETVSYGEERPLCTEHNESCWWKNRRAHFVEIME